jgi:alkanesulfonate monooxygenase SsuD/methylene tetrahydromethanopterin reductase-like flavin-dependent oxidoreductase (luciferase family)
MTAVTCPIMRYHPAIIAQGAATMALLGNNRFTLGLGTGERLNERVVGAGWPGRLERRQRLSEAIDIIQGLLGGYDHIILTQVGPEQDAFIDFYERELAPALRTRLAA